MEKYQQRKSDNVVITAFFEASTDSNEITLKQVEKKEKKTQNNIHFIFQNVPVKDEGKKLAINPSYIALKGLGAKQQVIVSEEDSNAQIHKISNPKLIVDNPDIIQISNLQVTAIRAGSTLLKVEKNGLSDSIRVDVKA